jgi:hypothetical protein
MKKLAALLLTACTVNTTDNFQNPPPPPPATCATSAVDGCTAGSVGYTCSSDHPDDGDTNLVCSAGTAAAQGTSYCCLPYGQYFTECTTDTTVTGCADPGFGFSCTGQTSPADADSRLACSAAIPSKGTDAAGFSYCCVSSEIASSCEADTALVCPGASVGFVCAGAGSPGENAAPVACSVGGAGEAGSTTRCCIPFHQAMDGCVENQQVGCLFGSFGFSCQPLHFPTEWNAAMACVQAPGNSASTPAFCCSL